MVDAASQGLLHPSIGRTDGWTQGVVRLRQRGRKCNIFERKAGERLTWGLTEQAKGIKASRAIPNKHSPALI